MDGEAKVVISTNRMIVHSIGLKWRDNRFDINHVHYPIA